ncbi:MAG: tetratricopeptide repeat protein [Phycisphaeraceae bacterium]
MNMLRYASLLSALMLVATLAGCVNQLSRDANRLNGYQAYRNEDYDTARERFVSVLDADPTDWRSHYYVGLIALNEDDDPVTARRHLDISYTIYQGRATKRLNYEIGDPKTGVPYPTRSDILDATAEAIYQQGNEQLLHAFLRQAVEEEGDVTDHLRMGRYMQKIGDPDSARSSYRAAIRSVGGSDPEPYIRYADFYESIGDQSRAATQLRKAYGIDPEHRGLGSRLRAHGYVPGPTVAIPHDQPEDTPPQPAQPEDDASDEADSEDDPSEE